MISGYDIANAFLLVYAGLFPIINPIGGAPIFLGLTRHCTDEERNALALGVTLNSFFLLLGSLLVGSYVLEFFGITLPIVRVAGGLVVAATGWSLLQARDEFADDRTAHEPKIPTDAFYPLTMPITVGPGSIAVAITIGSQRPRVAIARTRDPRRRGLRRHRRDRGDHICLLPICRRDRRSARRVGHQCGGAAVGLHPVLHRHRNYLERL